MAAEVAALPQRRDPHRTRRAQIESRRAMVSALILAGRTYRQIVEKLGEQGVDVSLGTVASDVQVIRRQWRERAAETYEEHLSEQVAVLDALLATFTPRAMNGDEKAADRVLRAVESKSRLLGLEAPTRVQAQVQVSIPELVAEGEAAILELASRRELEAPDP